MPTSYAYFHATQVLYRYLGVQQRSDELLRALRPRPQVQHRPRRLVGHLGGKYVVISYT